MNYDITIVGSGNAACAHAAMFSSLGHRVTIFKTSSKGNVSNFECIRESKTISVVGLGDEERRAGIYQVTDDGSVAFSRCDVCFVMVQTLFHKQVADLVSKYLRHAKLLFVVPGYMGSLYFQKRLGDRVEMIAEGESTAYDARIIQDGKVQILFKNVRNAVGVLKGDDASVLEIMHDLVDTYRYVRKNIVESALHNPNLIVHTIGAILSASRIEYSHGNFWMYKEAFTPSIWNVIERLDAEKMALLKMMGCAPLPYVEACKFRNCADLSVDALTVFKSYAEAGSPKGPITVRSRYIMEDVPMGLCLMRSIGEAVGVATPMCNALITIAESLVQEDFLSRGRTLQDLGVTELQSLMLA